MKYTGGVYVGKGHPVKMSLHNKYQKKKVEENKNAKNAACFLRPWFEQGQWTSILAIQEICKQFHTTYETLWYLIPFGEDDYWCVLDMGDVTPLDPPEHKPNTNYVKNEVKNITQYISNLTK